MGFVAGNTLFSQFLFPSLRQHTPLAPSWPPHRPICFKKSLLFPSITVPVHSPIMRATAKASGVKTPDDNQEPETTPEMDTPSNSFQHLLDGIGTLFSGVVGLAVALYVVAHKEKSPAVATIETDFLRELLLSLNQLTDQFELVLDKASKNQIIVAYSAQERQGSKESPEIESEKVNPLKHEVPITQNKNLSKSRNVKESNELRKEIEVEVSKLTSKVTEAKGSPRSSIDETKLGPESEKVNLLKHELLVTRKNLAKSRNASAELEKHLKELKVEVSKFLSKVTEAEESTQSSVDEAKLGPESDKVNLLKHELPVTQKNLGESNELKKYLEELEIEVSKLSSKVTKAKESLQRTLDDAKHGRDMVASELMTAKYHLKETETKLQNKTHELTTVFESYDNLQKKLFGIYELAGTIAEGLKEDKELFSSLCKDLQALEKALKDVEDRRSLEMKLKEAWKLLEEMNQKSLILCGELKRVNSLNSSLEKEKEVLCKSLKEQRNVMKKVQEKIVDAYDLTMKHNK